MLMIYKEFTNLTYFISFSTKIILQIKKIVESIKFSAIIVNPFTPPISSFGEGGVGIRRSRFKEATTLRSLISLR